MSEPPVRYVVLDGRMCDVTATGFDDSVVPLYVAAKHYDELKSELAAAQEALEQERMRLAACGVVAMANTPKSAAKARQMHEDYRSASLSDVERAVDAEMKLRADLAAAQSELAELKRGKVLADGMSNVIRGFILKRAERETLDEVAAKYRKWEEDYSHSNFTKDAP